MHCQNGQAEVEMADYFERLNYSLGDEDTALEYALLPQHARHVVGVSGCGGRLLPLLARSPARMTCVDISAPQLAFTRLRFALLEQTDHESFMDFMGFLSGASAKRRQSIFRHLDLPPPDRRWLADLFHSRHWGAPVYMGAFEQTLQRLAKINGLFTGKAGRAIFQCRDLGEQSAYYRRHFPLKRWKAVIALLGNAAVLNSLLYRGAFPRNNLGIRSREVYLGIFHTLFTTQVVRESFFLQMLFFGELRYPQGLPLECDPQLFQRARRALEGCELSVVQGDIFDCVAPCRDVDFVSLSDVPSFLPPAIGTRVLQRIQPALGKHALTVIRGHLHVVRPDCNGFCDVTAQFQDAIAREKTQLWRVQVYRQTSPVQVSR
jgi:S-adenosylmethionine-diacylglycerol 3-amino-3-carboxypropyl transferase